MSNSSRECLPKVLVMPRSGMVIVKDAFDETKSYVLFPKKEKSWTEYLQKQLDAGKVSK